MRCRIALFTDVRAAILFFSDGLRNPNFTRLPPPSQMGILGISQNPTPGILSNFSLRLARKFQGFLWRRMGIFFFPRPFWEFSPVADDRSDSHQETARKRAGGPHRL
jgi:hypothetical protein